MIGEQRERYQPQIDEWIRRVREIRGWEEDHSEVAIPQSTELWCFMEDYRWRRVLCINGAVVANPNVTIGVQAFQAKSHLNRFISVVEDLPPGIEDGFAAVFSAARSLHEIHPGISHYVRLRAPAGLPMEAYATGAPHTQEVDLMVSALFGPDHRQIGLGLRSPFHTVCPFQIFESDGRSHTQRTYLDIQLRMPVRDDSDPTSLLDFRPIIEELNVRMTPAQSRMRIPDETIHVLRAYTTPTYTEFGALQTLAIVRDTKTKWFHGEDQPVNVRIAVRSIESIFSNDIHSTLETTL